jgi:hypothetical protein
MNEQKNIDFQDLPVIKAIQILKNMKCQYVIITSDGRQFGEIKPTKKVIKRAPLFPRGTFINYFGNIMSQCQVGQTIEVPVGKFDAEVLRARVCAWATQRWGKDTYSTKISDNKILVLRYL